MSLYKLASVLLCYPEQDLIDNLSAIRQSVNQLTEDCSYIDPLLNAFATNDLITLQENYVQTFDRTPSQSLHLFEHIHGEDRLRGQALLDLMQEYQNEGVEVTANELPDYLPLFLEYLSLCQPNKAVELLGEAIDVIAHIRDKLKISGSAYQGIFDWLISQSTVAPKPLMTPPIRDMDEALEKFGPNCEGVEPLLSSNGLNPCSTCDSYARKQNELHR